MRRWLRLLHRAQVHWSVVHALVDHRRRRVEPLAPGRANLLDPFCGFGTTLIAAARLGLTGVGLEIEAARAQLACDRIGGKAHVVVGDVRASPFAASTFDLIATSVPYAPVRSVGSGADGAREPLVDGNLYASTSYAQHLTLLDDALAAAFATLRPGGVAIVCAENLRDDDGVLVPFAFDVARIVAQHAKLVGERIVCYPARADASSADASTSDRTHEHAFIAMRA